MKELNLTEGDWEFYPIYHEGTLMTAYIKNEKCSIAKVAPNNELNNKIDNAKAICKAVNCTYHKGIDPEAAEDMKEALMEIERIYESAPNAATLDTKLDPAIVEARKALKKAGVNVNEKTE